MHKIDKSNKDVDFCVDLHAKYVMDIDLYVQNCKHYMSWTLTFMRRSASILLNGHYFLTCVDHQALNVMDI